MKQFLHTIPASGRTVALASQLKRSDGSHLLDSAGELNAYDKSDLMKAIAGLIEVSGKHQVVSDSQAVSQAETAKVHREMVLAAMDSQEELAALGDFIVDEIKVTADRDGFMRRFLSYKDLTQGERPEVRLAKKQVIAAVATGPTQVSTQLIRDNVVFPNEFYITAKPYVEERDIQRSSVDLVEEKYLDALQAFMVVEDRVWKNMVDKIVGLDNDHLNIGGVMTPSALAHLQLQVTRWGLPASSWLIANDLWADITTDDGFQKVIDPVSQYEILMSGKLGTIYGLEILSDHYRHPEHKVLSTGEMYILSQPEYHGQYTDRGGVKSQVIDQTHESVPGRGWFMNELMSMVIGNPRSVARGRRLG